MCDFFTRLPETPATSVRHRHVFVCFVCFVVLVAPVPAAADVAAFLGKPIASVRVVIEGRETTDPTVIQILETEPGQPLTMARVRETVAHLFSLGRFEDVQVDAALENGRVALRYDLSPIHAVTNIQFTGTGAPGVDRGALRKIILD